MNAEIRSDCDWIRSLGRQADQAKAIFRNACADRSLVPLRQQAGRAEMNRLRTRCQQQTYRAERKQPGSAPWQLDTMFSVQMLPHRFQNTCWLCKERKFYRAAHNRSGSR